MAEIFLFIGTILVAFQIVGDIGYIATIFSMPFALPILPLMRKVGLKYTRPSPSQLGFEMVYGKDRNKLRFVSQFGWWTLLILVGAMFIIVTAATQPIMLAYMLICQPLLGINKLLNLIYKKTIEPWDFIYLVMMQKNINAMHALNIRTTKRNYSDKSLLKIRNKKGEIPFVAFIGVLFIIVGFIFQLIK